MAAISLRNGASAFVIQIPKSFAQPHMVEFKGHTWFYSRNSAGKYRLDVDQLRAVFIQSESLAQRIRSFRASRIASILGNEGPVPLPDLPKVVLHGIPLNSIEPGSTHDVSRFEEKASLLALGQGDNLPVSYRFNLDGYLVIHPFKNDPQHAFAYVQAFRDGSVEVCITGLMCEEDGDTPLRAKSVEREVAKVVNQMLTFQFEIGAEAPMVVMMSLLGVQGYRIPGSDRHPWEADPIIDRPDLILPEVMVDDLQSSAATVMRPVFDTMWNASGWPRSPSYDEDGIWKE